MKKVNFTAWCRVLIFITLCILVPQVKVTAEVKTATDRTFVRLSPDLREKAVTPRDEVILVSILVKTGTVVEDLMLRYAISRPVGELQWITGEVLDRTLIKLASIPGVLSIISTETYQPLKDPLDEELKASRKSLSAKEINTILKKGGKSLLRQRFNELQPTTPDIDNQNIPITSNSSETDLLKNQQVKNIHKAPQAWAKGYTGAGLVVGVVDTGVDFAHPDLQGTQARVSGGPYDGWPFAYDTISGINYIFDPTYTVGPNTYWDLFQNTWYAHTLTVTNVNRAGGVCTANLKIDYGTEVGWNWPPVVLPFTWNDTSKSGQYRYTVHPDYYLLYAGYVLRLGYAYSYIAPPAVLVVDETTPGVYDTIYVDVNFNQDFRDDKPMRKGNELAGADIRDAAGNPGRDGVWDLSAGMLSWISDDINPPPGLEALYPGQSLIPLQGRLLCFIGDSETHGTNCASDIAAQMVISDPYCKGPINQLFAGGSSVGGVGGPVLAGMAPQAKIAAFQNGFNLPFDAWTLTALGFDGVPETGDEVHICSNSWGDSSIINDGWDKQSRFAQYLNNNFAPQTTFVVSTGNGGHGYGTDCSPNGTTFIQVGASTSFGSLRIFEYVGVNQFVWGSVIPWSNRGPGMTGDIAPDVVAVGAFGTGANPLNIIPIYYNYCTGQAAYYYFGGTSMSTPVASGILALVYQAFLNNTGRYPTWQEAKTLLANGSQDLGYDVLTQGSGNLDADRSTDIAAGITNAIYPPQWNPGDYHGSKYESFPSIMFPGESSQQTFYLVSPAKSASRADKTVYNIKDTQLTRVSEDTFDISFAAGNPSAFRTPTWVYDLTNRINMYDPDLIRAEVVFPFNVFDAGEDYSYDNRWRVLIYDWTDLNGDGNLWTDNNGNGIVDSGEIDIDPITGKYEYNRITVGSNTSNYLEASIGRDTISRRHNGIFLGLQRRTGTAAVTLKVRITYYKKSDWNWLTVNPSQIEVTPGGKATFNATISIPSDTRLGIYQGAIEVNDGVNTSIIPVVVNVAAKSPNFEFGAISLDEPIGNLPYDNGHLSGGFDWTWRYESGDWKLFFYDIAPDKVSPGEIIVVDTRWKYSPTDVDTWIFGPVEDIYSMTDPEFFGPYSTELIGGSNDTYIGAGTFLFDTATGGPREIVSAELRKGLNFIALHNVLYAGAQHGEPIVGRAFKVKTSPYPVLKYGYSGTWQQTFISDHDIPEGLRASAFGLSQPLYFTEQLIYQDDPSDYCTASWIYAFDLANAGVFEIYTTSLASIDIDLLVFRDGGDGLFDCGMTGDDVLIAASQTSTAEEYVKIKRPLDGKYWILVHGWNVPNPPAYFDILINAIYGSDLTVSGLPTGPIFAGTPVTFNVSWNKPVNGEWQGILFIGTSSAPYMIEVPITIITDVIPTPTPIVSYDFEGDTDGWTFVPVAINSYDTQCNGAIGSYDGQRIGIQTDNNTSRFGFWVPSTPIPYVPDKLYKFVWEVATDQAISAAIPTFRFRVNESTSWSYNVEMVLTSVNGDYMPPASDTRVYNQYLLPINAGALTPYFDVYDFDTDWGTVYLEQLDVYLLDVPADNWSREDVPSFTSWNWGGTIPPYNPLGSGTAGGLQVSSTFGEDKGFGYWWSPLNSIAWSPDKLYRAEFNISSADTNTIYGGVRANSNDYNWTARLRFYGATAPDIDGNIYPLYFETASGTHFFLNFEGMDFENFRSGTNTLTNVLVETHDIP